MISLKSYAQVYRDTLSGVFVVMAKFESNIEELNEEFQLVGEFETEEEAIEYGNREVARLHAIRRLQYTAIAKAVSGDNYSPVKPTVTKGKVQ